MEWHKEKFTIDFITKVLRVSVYLNTGLVFAALYQQHYSYSLFEYAQIIDRAVENLTPKCYSLEDLIKSLKKE